MTAQRGRPEAVRDEETPAADGPVWDLLWANLPERADHPCLIDPDREASYGEVAAMADALAARLAGLGLRAGDRAIVHLRKGVDEVVAMLAAWRLGAVVVNVNHQWTVDQLLFVAGNCRARAAIVPAAVGRALAGRELPASLAHVVLRGGTPAAATDPRFVVWGDAGTEAALPAPARPDAGELAAIIYTSGSTGMPKGVMLSHRNIRTGAISVAEYLGLGADDRLLSVLPYSFDAGLNQLTTMLLTGGTVVHQAVTLAAEVVRTARERAVTGIAGVPPLWTMIVRYLIDSPTALPALRRVTNTGGKITPDILDAMPEVFPGVDVFLMYGLTEAFRSTYLPPERFARKKGAIGRAVPHAEIHVVRHGIGPAGPGETGELVHAGPLVSMGYWENPEATAARIRPSPELAALIGDRPVVWSGDLVRIDEEGDLWFVGRGDDMIKTMGFRLSPTEVEDHAGRSGLTVETVAFGAEDAVAGQVVHLACVFAGGADVAALRASCRRAMPAYMVPAVFHPWPGAMPRTASGKLDRPAIIAACTRGATPPSP